MIKKNLPNQIVLALFAFAVVQIVLALVLYYLNGQYFNSSNWLRWDSGHYLQIAKGGYEFFPCDGKYGLPSNGSYMCGNTGWFPGYPLLIKLFSFFYNDAVIVAGVLSKLFYILSIFVVIKILNLNEFSIKNTLLLFITAFSFSFIYYNAIFPISCVSFFVLSGLYFFIHRKIWLTSLFCFLASFFYPTGFLLAVVFAVTILFRKNECFKQKISELLIPIIMGALGIILVFLIFQITVNDWTAFIQVQAKYGHSFQSPVKNMGSFFHKQPLLNAYSIKNFVQYQSLLVIIGYILVSFCFFFNRMFKNELYFWTYIYLTLFFLFPWSVGGDLSRYRAESLLLPFVFILKETNSKWLALILICLIGIGIPMSYLFFTGTLI